MYWLPLWLPSPVSSASAAAAALELHPEVAVRRAAGTAGKWNETGECVAGLRAAAPVPPAPPKPPPPPPDDSCGWPEGVESGPRRPRRDQRLGMKNRCRRGFHLLLLLGRRLVGRSWNWRSRQWSRNHRVRCARERPAAVSPNPRRSTGWRYIDRIEVEQSRGHAMQPRGDNVTRRLVGPATFTVAFW